MIDLTKQLKINENFRMKIINFNEADIMQILGLSLSKVKELKVQAALIQATKTK
jgi:hypothetical protein